MKRALSSQELTEGIRADVIGARQHFEVYRTWMHTRYRLRYREVFIVYGNFIACDLRAHFAGMVTCVGRIFDSNPKAIGIAALLKADPSLEQVKPALLANARKLWDEKVIYLRHQVVAHRSGGSNVEDAFKRAGISLNDLGRMIALCDKLIDAWSRKLGCHVHNSSGAKGDLMAVLDALMRSRQERTRRLASTGRSKTLRRSA
jgi:HEPN superfamily AbiU2-like protein